MTVISRIIENKDLPKNKKKHDEIAKHVSTDKLRCEVNNCHRGSAVGTFTSFTQKVGCQRAGRVHKFLSVSSHERKSSCRSNLTRTLYPQIRSWPEVCTASSKDRKGEKPKLYRPKYWLFIGFMIMWWSLICSMFFAMCLLCLLTIFSLCKSYYCYDGKKYQYNNLQYNTWMVYASP